MAMVTMKMSEALGHYRTVRQNIIDKRAELVGQRESLNKRPGGAEAFSDEAAVLELSIEGLNEQEKENNKKLDELIEEYTAVWNLEVSKQQADAYEKMGEDLGKIIEVARRISKGDKVPPSDEKKLMDYSFEMYQAAKSMAVISKKEDRKEHDSLWDDEDEKPNEEYDPKSKADNTEVTVDIADADVPAPVETE